MSRLVIVESPFADAAVDGAPCPPHCCCCAPGDECCDCGEIVGRNLLYARAALADCLRRGEAPIASHLLYTQPGVLNDNVPAERTLGIEAGLAWGRVADGAVFYTDLGWSAGMLAARDRHLARFSVIEERTLEGWAA